MRQRRAILVGFAVALFLGVAVYFRLWAIDRQDDSTATADDREALRSATVSLAFALFLVAFPLSLAFPLLSHFNLIGNTQYIIFFFVHHRRQFERANMEAMDESAEWRMKYDGEVERNKQVQDELEKVHLLFAKASLSSATKRFDRLQKVSTSTCSLVFFIHHSVHFA
ncbi:hypothetical protein BHM03_00010403 [Ensete ventricosum]|nr:hypothetical protein BHM03_00010403 [Ensete ventricosum]